MFGSITIIHSWMFEAFFLTLIWRGFVVTSPSLSVKCRMFWVESASVHEIMFFFANYIYVYLVDHLQLFEHEAT
jgi:hypothetical protein